jgi:hypothetical protein
MANGARATFWRRLRGFHWGEAALWLAFAVAVLAATQDGSGREAAVTLAGIFALAAIGVRATRPDDAGEDANA